MEPVVLEYQPALSSPNSWCLAPEGGGIRARVRLGDAAEVVVDAHLRYRRVRRAGLVHVQRIDEGTWATESTTFDGQLGVPVVLCLSGASEHASASLALL